MSNHINTAGQFQSDLHPNLAPDKIVLSFKDPVAIRALATLATDYQDVDADLSRDINLRLASIIDPGGHHRSGPPEKKIAEYLGGR